MSHVWVILSTRCTMCIWSCLLTRQRFRISLAQTCVDNVDKIFIDHRRCKQTCKLVLACTPPVTEDSLFAVCGRREVNVPGVHRQQESRDTGNWTMGLGGGADIWWEVGVVRGGLMVKQRGAHIPWVFALCPVDLALCHLTERSTLSAPLQSSDLAGFEQL